MKKYTESTAEEAMKLRSLSRQVEESVLHVLVPAKVKLGEGLVVIASGLVEVLDTMADVAGKNRREIRKLFTKILES